MKRLRTTRRLPLRRRGIVLVVVMVVVAMVALAGFGFVATMSTEYRAVDLNGDDLQAQQAIGSGEMFVRFLAEQSREAREEMGGLENNPTLFRDIVVNPAALTDGSAAASGSTSIGTQRASASAGISSDDPEADAGVWRFSVVSPPQTSDPAGVDAGLRFGLDDESARLNLYTLWRIDRRSPGRGREILMRLPGMTEIAADSILDWVDRDDVTREMGAESEYYQNLRSPYRPRNRIPRSLDELLLVRGVTEQLLYGYDADRDYRLSEAEQTRAEAGTTQRSSAFDAMLGTDGEEHSVSLLGWSHYLTLHSAERDVDRAGQPRVNLNHRDLTELHQQLSELLPEELANFILAWRQYGPARASSSSQSAETLPIDSAKPSKFRFSSVVLLIDSSIAIKQGKKTVTYQSPVSAKDESLEELLPLLLEHTTLYPRERIPARINIHKAPPAVLLAIPGLNEEIVEELVSQRESLDESASRTVAWLLTEGILDARQFRAVLPYVTVGGNVFRAQVVGYRKGMGPVRRVEVVIDATGERARRVDRRELR